MGKPGNLRVGPDTFPVRESPFHLNIDTSAFISAYLSQRSLTLSLQSITIPPQTDRPATGVIVMLHGWGANAQDLVPIAPLTNLPDYQFIFPEAPFPHPYTFSGKMWYDLESKDYQGLTESRESLRDWLQRLEAQTQIPLERTILSGFSQGGAMTLDVGLDLPLAGLVCFSGYLHPSDRPVDVPYPPVLLLHGCQDTVVPLRAAEQAYHALQNWGVPVEYETYPTMGHEIQPPLLEKMHHFVQTLPAFVAS